MKARGRQGFLRENRKNRRLFRAFVRHSRRFPPLERLPGAVQQRPGPGETARQRCIRRRAAPQAAVHIAAEQTQPAADQAQLAAGDRKIGRLPVERVLHLLRPLLAQAAQRQLVGLARRGSADAQLRADFLKGQLLAAQFTDLPLPRGEDG